jgi:serine/threonine protein kinase
MNRGQLKDGSLVAIRSVKLTKSCRTRDFMQHIELISKFRHHHLVSVLGHCFEHYLDDSNVRRIFIVFEYVPNGSLKTWITGKFIKFNIFQSLFDLQNVCTGQNSTGHYKT